jgi:hypothetical protein
VTTAALALSLAVSAALAWLGWVALRALLPGPRLQWTPALRVVIGTAAVLFAAGIWWGWPLGIWAPDEMWPDIVLKGLTARFSNGWFDLYPPLHFYVLTVAMAPVLAADALGVTGLSPERTLDVLALVGRGVSLAMSLGFLALLARFAQQSAGRDYGWPVALCAGATLPLVFYAKTSNMDVPYVFWFAASLLFYRASLGNPDTPASSRSLIGFAVTAACAVTTKDQAYALYVLPIAWLVFRTMRRPSGVIALSAAFVAGALTFAVVHNLWANADGFSKHLALIVGDGSESFRLVPMTLAGEWWLLKITAWQAFWCLGIPGTLLFAIGLWRQAREPIWPAWLWLFPISYLLTFVAIIGYVYDRFLLAPLVIAALFGATGLRWLVDSGRSGRVAAAVMCLWLTWRVVSVDVLLIGDSRYDAEAWLRANVPAGSSVASVWQAGYLPRFRGLRYQEIRPTAEATLRANPDVIVVNSEFVNRYPPDAPQPRWLAWLQSADGPYREVYRYKASLKMTELQWWPMFVDRRETFFTNLDKANPEIVIFRRR